MNAKLWAAENKQKQCLFIGEAVQPRHVVTLEGAYVPLWKRCLEILLERRSRNIVTKYFEFGFTCSPKFAIVSVPSSLC